MNSTTQKDAAEASINPSGTLKTSLTIYFTILAAGVVLFECLRHRYRHAYDSRGYQGNTFWTQSTASTNLFGWMWSVYQVSDDELLERCGLDTLSFFRFLRIGQKVALVAIVASALLFPLYATTDAPRPSTRRHVDPLERITMSNLPVGSQRIWAPTLVTYVVCLYMMYLLWQEYEHYKRRRHEILSKTEAAQYTILINDLPIHLRTQQTIERFVQRLFPASVRSVYVAVECGRLEDYVAERNEVRNALEHALAELDVTGKRPQMREGRSYLKMLLCRHGANGRLVDAIDAYEQQLAKLNEKVRREIDSIEAAQAELARQVEEREETRRSMNLLQGRALEAQLQNLEEMGQENDETPLPQHPSHHHAKTDEEEQEERVATIKKQPIRVMRPAAFVSFTSLMATQLAKQSVQSSNPVKIAVAPAPHIDDVKWENVGVPYRKRAVWRLVSGLITALIVLFWTIPTAFVASLATVDSLRHALPFLNKAFDQYPLLEEFFKQLAPLTLVALSALAPVIFDFLSSREGHASSTEVRASLFTKLAYFQLIQIFFVLVVVGTILDSLKQILDQPKMLIDMLGRSMPQQSTFFMSYVIILTGLSFTLELLRAVPMLLSLLFSLLAPKLTKRERRSSWFGLCDITQTEPFDPTRVLADCFLVMLVTLTFASIAPLVCYFTGFFFLVCDLVYRRQVLFVYKPAVFAMGAYWPPLFKFMIIAMVLSQLTLMGIVSLKQAPTAFALIGVLVFLILLFNHYMSALYPRVAKNLPLTDCKHLDEVRSHQDPDATFYFVDNVYRQPAMSQRAPVRPDYRMITQEFEDGTTMLSSDVHENEEDRRFLAAAT